MRAVGTFIIVIGLAAAKWAAVHLGAPVDIAAMMYGCFGTLAIVWRHSFFATWRAS